VVQTSSSSVPEQAQATKEEAVGQAGALKDTALEHVGTLTGDVKDRASGVARDVRGELESQADSQAKRAASMLHDVGTQLTDMAEGAQPGAVQDVTRQLASRSRQVATRLEEHGVQGVGDDLRRFARRQPGLFLTAAGVAGFVVARVFRSAQSAQGSGHGNAQTSRQGGMQGLDGGNGLSGGTANALQSPAPVVAPPGAAVVAPEMGS